MTGKRVAVLGAGAIGVCVALYLQRAGHDVVLVDQDEPGNGCTFGNAGLIQCASVVPVATPGIVRAVPRMLLDRTQPLHIRWRYLPSLAPYLLHFLRESRLSRVAANARALASIVPRAYDDYLPLIEAAGIGAMVRPSGELHVFETDAAFAAAKAGGFAIRRAHGVRVEELDGDAVRDLEPNLSPTVRHGLFLPDCYQTVNPRRFVAALCASFVASGGEFRRARVDDVEARNGGGVRIVTQGGNIEAATAVLAFGAFSGPLAKRLGTRVRLNSERGYHIMLPQPGVTLNRTVVSGEYRFALAPIDGNVRITGAAELARVGAPPDYSRARRLLPLARHLLPGLDDAGQTLWMGHRPSTPDSLPLLGRTRANPDVVFAFGHNHSGLTLGGTTGRLIADLVGGRAASVDLTPFSPTRFHD
ncbi:FAD-binding oxidoreductase [Mesorhizobium sp. DCY119]|uniref:NAD(P)/FAD-dependent oxidoreductase n=1 Tax=Mesorhizobium sp. DCY119 TaxID=2108445 RepID=UPI000E727812|nr:FAD-binding oxidoreductase [Mesorhizobium sp. DCY119]RJG40532.1 FAD-binding oxidoreductase [Mesorhizobium sp. DCY119]